MSNFVGDFQQRMIGLREESGKTDQLGGVILSLVVAVICGIVAIALLSTNVGGDAPYFSKSGHVVGIILGAVTILLFGMAFYLVDGATECSQFDAPAHHFMQQPQQQFAQQQQQIAQQQQPAQFYGQQVLPQPAVQYV